MSTRNFLRKRRLYESEGFDGNYDRRLGRRSGRRADDKEVERLTKLYKDRYEGFSVKHFHEFAVRIHNLQYGYTWMKTMLIDAGLVKKDKRGGPHRKRRERRPMEGMMIHQDASTHDWIPCLGHKVDLIVTVEVREYLDGTLAVFHGHRCLGRYTAKGEIINDLKLAA